MSEFAELKLEGKTYKLPIITGQPLWNVVDKHAGY